MQKTIASALSTLSGHEKLAPSAAETMQKVENGDRDPDAARRHLDGAD
jgi:hypothetical protein